MHGTDKICFIHSSDEYRDNFSSKDATRPTFYWLTDRYFDHVACGNYSAWKYLYFFIKNPKEENIEFSSRHDGLGFDSLFKKYVEFSKWAKNKEAGVKNDLAYCEPGIMCSFSIIKPNLIAKYDENKKDFVVMFPDEFKGQKLNLFYENGFPRSFVDTNIHSIFSELTNVLPFVEPRRESDMYAYDNWVQMKNFSGKKWI
jgi:hypothetical protein